MMLFLLPFVLLTVGDAAEEIHNGEEELGKGIESLFRVGYCRPSSAQNEEATRQGMSKNWELIAETQLDLPHEPNPWNMDVCKEFGVPAWYNDSIRYSNDITTITVESAALSMSHKCGMAAAESEGEAPMPLPKEAPSHSGPEVQIERIQRGSFSVAEFYEEYIRRGVPVILSDPFDEEEKVWWEGRAELSLILARAEHANMDVKEYEKMFQMSESGEPTFHHPPEPEKAVFCDICEEMEPVPEVYYPWPFQYPRIMKEASLLRESFDSTMTIWGRYNFSTPLHYDQSCHGSLSLQHIGEKRWWLWAPWDIERRNGTMISAHTRFTADLKPGEILMYGPAWYHQTQTLGEELSLATVVFLKDPPFFGILPEHFRSPRGFAACAEPEGGWLWRDTGWENSLKQSALSPNSFSTASKYVRCVLENEDSCLNPATIHASSCDASEGECKL
eukprot:jgi/Bigna1/126277/aug1.2_g985